MCVIFQVLTPHKSICGAWEFKDLKLNWFENTKVNLLDSNVYDVYNRLVNSKQLIKELKKAGWTVKRVKGSHHQMGNSNFGFVITVPHPKKDLPKGLVKAIMKKAGI